MANHRIETGGLGAGVPAAASTGGSGRVVVGHLRAHAPAFPLQAVASGTAAGRRLPLTLKRRLIQSGLVVSAVLWAADNVYRIVNDISYISREKCVLFKVFPRIGFLIFEYFFETIMIVLVGIFVAVVLARGFSRCGRFLPRNPLSAFVYGSIIPVCSCAVIPLVSTMKGRMKFATTMSFILAAPLLSPYIIVLSFSVLGLTYGILRIASSFVLVMSSVFILSLLRGRSASMDGDPARAGCSRACSTDEEDVYLRTFEVFKKLFPFLVLAGAVGICLEYLGPRNLLIRDTGWGQGPLGVLLWAGIGIPLYFCHGAEVLFLRPLVTHGFPVGTAIAFSLTSTAICTTAIAMLLGIIGRRLTAILAACVLGISLVLALVINGFM